MESVVDSEDRIISMGEGLAAIPEELLLAHARGEVLFVCGAGISMPANLPRFRQLVLDVYRRLDPRAWHILKDIPADACNRWPIDGLDEKQTLEARCFIRSEYDVTLGLLERRMDGPTRRTSTVREAVHKQLREGSSEPAAIHHALMALADRGGSRAIVTTNFDLLLEDAARRLKRATRTYSLGSIPRPSRSKEFDGVLHIHGALDADPSVISELILSDQDFGEYYMRRRFVLDFVYDAARIYHLVLVGYRADDPPMRYLLHAIAADQYRFKDLKERFVFVGMDEYDPVLLEDWRGRGIVPIQYDSNKKHQALRLTLERWAKLSVHAKDSEEVALAELERIVKTARAAAPDSDRDLFDHLFRRSNTDERQRMAKFVSEAKAEIGWLNAIADICRERPQERSP